MHMWFGLWISRSLNLNFWTWWYGVWIKTSSIHPFHKYITHITSYTLIRHWYLRLVECTVFDSFRDHKIPLCIQWPKGKKEKREDRRKRSSPKAPGPIIIYHSPHSAPRGYPHETGLKAENKVGLKCFFTPKERLEYYLKKYWYQRTSSIRITCVPEVNERDGQS